MVLLDMSATFDRVDHALCNMLMYDVTFHLFVYVTRSRGMSHMSAIFNFEFSTLITCPFKMLHFDPNPTSIGHLVAEI